jgi:hypothetical protein
VQHACAVETAAHLADHVFSRLPVRQWVLSVPKRLRYFMQRDGAVLDMVLRIFLRVIAQSLQTHCPGAAQMDKATLHIGAIAFIHRFGSSLNGHVYFHMCALDGVFEEVAGQGDADACADADAQSSPPCIFFHPASAIDETAVAQVQTDLRRRILRAFAGRGLLGSCDAKDMLGYPHSGFSVDAGVRIESHDRAALERRVRYCAAHTLPWSAFAKRAPPWSTAAPSSAASLALTSVAPRSTSCTSHRWN